VPWLILKRKSCKISCCFTGTTWWSWYLSMVCLWMQVVLEVTVLLSASLAQLVECCGTGPASPSRDMVRPDWWWRNGVTVSSKLDWSKGAGKHVWSISHEREFPRQRCKPWTRPWSWPWSWAWMKPRELTR